MIQYEMSEKNLIYQLGKSKPIRLIGHGEPLGERDAKIHIISVIAISTLSIPF